MSPGGPPKFPTNEAPKKKAQPKAPDAAPQIPEVQKSKETVESIRAMFVEAQQVLETQGRDPAKLLLPKAYNALIEANKWDKSNWMSMTWNPEGDLTEEEFKELDRSRKILSNNIGIMATDKDGKPYIRHDLNEL